MLPEWTKITFLPPSCHWITDRYGDFLYRKLINKNDGLEIIEQVICNDGDGTYTFYHGHWPDHPGITSAENAKIVADSKAEYWLSFEPCDN